MKDYSNSITLKTHYLFYVQLKQTLVTLKHINTCTNAYTCSHLQIVKLKYRS